MIVIKKPVSRFDSVAANLMLSVALWVALISFFIILNAFSSYNTHKLAIARHSVDYAFGFVGQGLSIDDVSGREDAMAGDLEVAASGALRSVLPDLGFSSFNTGSGQVMQVDIPLDRWTQRFKALQMRLADLMIYDNPDGRYVLHIMALNGQEGKREALAAAVRLQKDGVRAQDISVGIVDGGQQVMRLQFIMRRAVQNEGQEAVQGGEHG